MVMGLKAPIQTLHNFVGVVIFWTLITKKCNNTLGVDFFAQWSLGSRSFLPHSFTKKKHVGFLKSSLPTSTSFLGHLSLGR